MKRIVAHIFSLFVLSAVMTSCLFENDMSYPYVKGEFVSFAVEGQKSVTIDSKTRTVSVVLEETADISRVKVTDVKLNGNASLSKEFKEPVNLSEPYEVYVRTYQDYLWIIKASQPIVRYVDSPQNAKAPLISPGNRTVLMYLLPNQKLNEVVIDAMKLEKEGTEIISTTGYEVRNGVSEKITRDLSADSFPITLDCASERTFTVRYDDGKEIEWKLSAVRRKGELKVHSVVPWS